VTIKAMDVKSAANVEVPAEDWLNWLGDQGYLIADRISLGPGALELYQREDGVYALYHPPLRGLSVACLFINIPDAATAQELIDLAQKMLGILTWANHPSSTTATYPARSPGG
jgi:hypothetical protein